MPAFRRGQWVVTTRPLVFPLPPVAGQELTLTIPAGVLGIQHPLDAARVYHYEGGQPQVGKALDGLVGLHLVDEATGFATTLEAAVPEDALTALLDRNAIPAPRLATMDPNWEPRA